MINYLARSSEFVALVEIFAALMAQNCWAEMDVAR